MFYKNTVIYSLKTCAATFFVRPEVHSVFSEHALTHTHTIAPPFALFIVKIIQQTDGLCIGAALDKSATHGVGIGIISDA